MTGLGICSPVGTGVETVWKNLLEGKSGIGPTRAFDAANLRSRIAGEVTDFEPEKLFSRKLLKRTARFSQLALAATNEALSNSGLAGSGDLESVAVIVGSGIGGFDLQEREHQVFLSKGPASFAPFTIPMVIPNVAAGVIAIETGCRGPNLCIATACATGAHSIGTAFDMVRHGRVDVAVAGSSESTISPYAIDGYCQLRALSTRNDEPKRASRPFDVDRDGFVIAEGAAVLILEEGEHARARGVPILAELAGYATTADGYHLTAPEPSGQGAVRAMRGALADAEMRPDEVDVINAHGTSTRLNDPTETAAIKEVFEEHARRLVVHATKSMTGHSLGGAASIEAVVSVLTIARGGIHPTINLDRADPECDLDYVAHEAREEKVRSVMSNAFAFGGHNAVLVFRSARA